MGLLRERPPGKGDWRLNLHQERRRRVRDAREQPRTRRGWWTGLSEPRPRRVSLDAEGRRWYEERDWELRQQADGLRAELRDLRISKRTDRLDAGRQVNVREAERHHAKRYNAYGSRTAQVDRYAGNVEAVSRAQDRAREIRADLTAAEAERRQVRDAIVFGEVPHSGHWRRRRGLR